MAIEIVVSLETIGIDHDQCQRRAGLLRALEMFVQIVLEITPIADAGQEVITRGIPVAAFGLLLRDGHHSETENHHDRDKIQHHRGKAGEQLERHLVAMRQNQERPNTCLKHIDDLETYDRQQRPALATIIHVQAG